MTLKKIREKLFLTERGPRLDRWGCRFAGQTSRCRSCPFRRDRRPTRSWTVRSPSKTS